MKTSKKAAVIAPEYVAAFDGLKGLLQAHSHRFKVTADDQGHYCLEVPFSPKLGKGYPVAWVKISKAYVSYHFMPVYMFPKLREQMSDRLKARMQGKSCFNFQSFDESLYQELGQITEEGLEMSRQAGIGG
jgi:hypothetical protein